MNIQEKINLVVDNYDLIQATKRKKMRTHAMKKGPEDYFLLELLTNSCGITIILIKRKVWQFNYISSTLIDAGNFSCADTFLDFLIKTYKLKK